MSIHPGGRPFWARTITTCPCRGHRKRDIARQDSEVLPAAAGFDIARCRIGINPRVPIRRWLEDVLAGAGPRQHGGQFVWRNVDVLADPSPQHGRGDVAAAALFPGAHAHNGKRRRSAGVRVSRSRTSRRKSRMSFRDPAPQGLNSVFSFFFTATPLIFT